MKSAITLASIVLGLAVAACGSDKTTGEGDRRHNPSADAGADVGNSEVDSGCRHNCGREDGGSDVGHDGNGPSDVGSPDVPVTHVDASDGGSQDGNRHSDANGDSADANGRDGSQDGSESFDASTPDASVQTNTAPNVVLIYEQSHPLTNQEYVSRNVRRQRDTTFLARGYDAENDRLEYKCDFGDGTIRDWNTDPRCIHGFDNNGNYSLVVRVRDPQGLEGSVSATLNVVNNIPPVAKAGPDVNGLSTWTNYRFNFGTNPSDSNCTRGTYAPGHSAQGTGSFDEDGTIVEYKIYPDFVHFPESRSPGPCSYIAYSETGNFLLRLETVDDEGAVSVDEANVEVSF